VLEIIEHQQESSMGEGGDDRFQKRTIWFPTHAKRAGNGVGDLFGFGKPRERDEDHTVPEVVCCALCGGKGEASFSGSPRPEHRDEPLLRVNKEATQSHKVGPAADEGGLCSREPKQGRSRPFAWARRWPYLSWPIGQDEGNWLSRSFRCHKPHPDSVRSVLEG
jgi:hypothetical protein